MTARPFSQQIIRMVPTGGGGGSNPDPVIYCPANGYIPDPDIYTPPVVLPDIPAQTIVCICNASIGHWRCLTFSYNLFRSGGDQYKYEIFDNTGVLINTFTSYATALDFDFPTSIGYYTVKISLNPPSYFTGFYNNNNSNTRDCNIEAVLMNTPNMTYFAQRGNKNFKNVEWLNAASFEALNYIAFMLENCPNVSSFKFRDDVNYNFPSKSFSMYNAFSGTSIRKIDLSKFNTTNDLNLTDFMFRNCKYLDEVIFPSVWRGSRSSQMFDGTIRLRKVTMPDRWISSIRPYLDGPSFFFRNSGVEGEIVFNQLEGVITAVSWSYVAQNCPNLLILRIKGIYTGLSTSSFQYCINQCPNIKIFEAPRSVGNTVYSGYPFDSTSISLETYIGPDVGYIGLPTANSPLKSITGEHNTAGCATLPYITIPSGALVRANLTTLQMIKLRVQYFQCGIYSTKLTSLTTLDIDWAGSTFSSTSVPQLTISAALSASELNRIMTALPTVVGKTFDMGGCDGYFTCTKSIAEAKGWAIRGFAFLTTADANTITKTTAILGGNISFDGSYPVTTRGVCYAITALPTTSNTKTVNGTGTGSFEIVSGTLTANKLYYIRAYAVTTYGTVYGEQKTFTTLP